MVIRRLLAELRKAGLTDSRRGVGAGWMLSREPAAITLLDVYEAVKPGSVFALHRSAPDPECVVGRGIGPVMTAVYDDVEAALRGEHACHAPLPDPDHNS